MGVIVCGYGCFFFLLVINVRFGVVLRYVSCLGRMFLFVGEVVVVFVCGWGE